MASKENLKTRLLDFINPRILHTVATKECIYRKLNESIPFADVEVNVIDSTKDEVKIKFSADEISFNFLWKEPALSCGSKKNFNLYKIC